MPHAGYSGSAYRRPDRKQVLDAAERILGPLKFDAIAVRGVSGLLMGPLIAHILDKQIIVVRKPYEVESGKSHSTILVESLYAKGERFKYVFVDDMSCSGHTFRTVLKEVMAQHAESIHIGSFYYSGGNPNFKPADGSAPIY